MTISLAAVLAMSWMAPALSASAAPVVPNTGGAVAPSSLPVSVPVPNPPLNAVALFALQGDYSYTSAGVAMRNSGYGTITVSWTGTLKEAFLIWGVINPTTAGLESGVINGFAVTGTQQSQDVSPCWGNGDLTVFAADVTSVVNNGANSLTGFASGITTGQDPWSAATAPLDEGASLVVIYTPTTAVSNQVYIYTGTYTEEGYTITSVFNHGATIGTTATTTFIAADGQLDGNTASWNGAIIDANAFPGGDHHDSSATWSYGSLWDTKTYPVTETLGSTSDSASIGGTGDCVTWAAQVLSFPSNDVITVSTSTVSTVTGNGVPQFGVSAVLVAVIGLALVTVLARKMQVPQITKA